MASWANLRPGYLKMMVQTLKENVKKTSTLELDDDVMTHFGMKVEESCLDKPRGLDSYTKAITAARLKIERYTAQKKLYPMIAESLHVDNSEIVTNAENDKVAQKRTIPLDDDNKTEPAKRSKYEMDSDVIIIGSSGSENEQDNDDDDDASEDHSNNNAPKGEILISVQTTPIVEIISDKDSQ